MYFHIYFQIRNSIITRDNVCIKVDGVFMSSIIFTLQTQPNVATLNSKYIYI